MGIISYCWNRMLKKLRGCAICNSSVNKTAKIESGSTMVNSSIGKYSFCGYDCKLINCSIGAFCSIADNVVAGGVQHPVSWASTSPVFYAGQDSIKKKFSTFQRSEDQTTIIGNDVWIGERVLIKGGVTIEDGAVIGIGSVVSKDIGAYEIWAGSPARLIRKRFDDAMIERMVSSRWWDCSDAEIQMCADSITGTLNASLFISV